MMYSFPQHASRARTVLHLFCLLGGLFLCGWDVAA